MATIKLTPGILPNLIDKLRKEKPYALSNEEIKNIITNKEKEELSDNIKGLLEFVDIKVDEGSRLSNITEKKAQHIRSVIIEINEIIQTQPGSEFAGIFKETQNKKLLYEKIISELDKEEGKVEDKVYKIIEGITNPVYHIKEGYQHGIGKTNIAFSNNIEGDNISLNERKSSLFADEEHEEKFYNEASKININIYEDIKNQEYLEENTLRKLYKLFGKTNQFPQEEPSKEKVEQVKIIEKIVKEKSEELLNLKSNSYEETIKILKSFLNDINDENVFPKELSEEVRLIKEEYIKHFLNIDLLHGLYTEKLSEEFKDKEDLAELHENSEELYLKEKIVKNKIMEDLNISNNYESLFAKDIRNKIIVSSQIVHEKPKLRKRDLDRNSQQKQKETKEKLRDKINILDLNQGISKVKLIDNEVLVNLFIDFLNKQKKNKSGLKELMKSKGDGEYDDEYLTDIIDFLKDIDTDLDSEKMDNLLEELMKIASVSSKPHPLGLTNEEIKELSGKNWYGNVDEKAPKIIFKLFIEKSLSHPKKIKQVMKNVNGTKLDKEKEEQIKNKEQFDNLVTQLNDEKNDETKNLEIIDLIKKNIEDIEGNIEDNKLKKQLIDIKETIENTVDKNSSFIQEMKSQLNSIASKVSNKTKKEENREEIKNYLRKSLKRLIEPQHVLDYTLTEAHKIEELKLYESKDENERKKIVDNVRLNIENMNENKLFIPIGYYLILFKELNNMGTHLSQKEIMKLKQTLLKTIISKEIISQGLQTTDYEEYLTLIEKEDLNDAEIQKVNSYYQTISSNKNKEKYFNLEVLTEDWGKLNVKREGQKIIQEAKDLTPNINKNKKRRGHVKDLEGDLIERENIYYIDQLSEDVNAIKINKSSEQDKLEDTMLIGINRLSQRKKDTSKIDISDKNKDYIKTANNLLGDMVFKYKSVDILSAMFDSPKELETFRKKDDEHKKLELADKLLAMISLDGKLIKDLDQSQKGDKKDLIKKLIGDNLDIEEDKGLRKFQVFFKRYLYSSWEVLNDLEKTAKDQKDYKELVDDKVPLGLLMFKDIKKERILNLNEENLNKKIDYIDNIKISAPHEQADMWTVLSSLEAHRVPLNKNETDLQKGFNTYARILSVLKTIKLPVLGNDKSDKEKLDEYVKRLKEQEFINTLFPQDIPDMNGMIEKYALEVYDLETGKPDLEKIDNFFTSSNSEKIRKIYKDNDVQFNTKSYQIVSNYISEKDEEAIKEQFKKQIKQKKQENHRIKENGELTHKTLMGVYLNNSNGDELTTDTMKNTFKDVFESAIDSSEKESVINLYNKWKEKIQQKEEQGEVIDEIGYYRIFKELMDENQGYEKAKISIKNSFAKKIDVNPMVGKELIERLLDDSWGDITEVSTEINEKIRTRQLKDQEKDTSPEKLQEKISKLQYDKELVQKGWYGEKTEQMKSFVNKKSWSQIKKDISNNEDEPGYIRRKMLAGKDYLEENYSVGKMFKNTTSGILGGIIDTGNELFKELVPRQYGHHQLNTRDIKTKYEALLDGTGKELGEMSDTMLKNLGISPEYIKKRKMTSKERREYGKRKREEDIKHNFFRLLGDENLLNDNKDLMEIVCGGKKMSPISEMVKNLQKGDLDNLIPKYDKNGEEIKEGTSKGDKQIAIWKEMIVKARDNLQQRTNESLLSSNFTKKEKYENLKNLFDKLVNKPGWDGEKFLNVLLDEKTTDPMKFIQETFEYNYGKGKDKDPSLHSFLSIITGGDNATGKIDINKLNKLVLALTNNTNKLNFPKNEILETLRKNTENKYESDVGINFYLLYKENKENMKKGKKDEIGLTPKEFFEILEKEKKGEITQKNQDESKIKAYNKIRKRIKEMSIDNLSKGTELVKKWEFSKENETKYEAKELSKLIKDKIEESDKENDIAIMINGKLEKSLEKLLEQESLKDGGKEVTESYIRKIQKIVEKPISLREKEIELNKLNTKIIAEKENINIQTQVEGLTKREQNLDTSLSSKRLVTKLRYVKNLDNIIIDALKLEDEEILNYEELMENLFTNSDLAAKEQFKQLQPLSTIFNLLREELVKGYEDDSERIEELLKTTISKNSQAINEGISNRIKKRASKMSKTGIYTPTGTS